MRARARVYVCVSTRARACPRVHVRAGEALRALHRRCFQAAGRGSVPGQALQRGARPHERLDCLQVCPNVPDGGQFQDLMGRLHKSRGPQAYVARLLHEYCPVQVRTGRQIDDLKRQCPNTRSRKKG